jgi:hypothetical protein
MIIDTPTARVWVERGLKMRESLVDTDPSNIEFQYNLAVSWEQLGELAQAAGDTAAACAWFERAG